MAPSRREVPADHRPLTRGEGDNGAKSPDVAGAPGAVLHDISRGILGQQALGLHLRNGNRRLPGLETLGSNVWALALSMLMTRKSVRSALTVETRGSQAST